MGVLKAKCQFKEIFMPVMIFVIFMFIFIKTIVTYFIQATPLVKNVCLII